MLSKVLKPWKKAGTNRTMTNTQAASANYTPLVLVHSDEYENWVFDPTHPTQGRRFTNGRKAIVEQFGDQLTEIEPRLATYNELALVHSPSYINSVLMDGVCEQWSGPRMELANLAQQFVGGTLVALNELMSGRTLRAVHLPGAKHHAQYDRSSGFCVFADFAIAAHIATSHGLKVAIFDFDAHHGDGTENLCRENSNILTYSIHQRGIFPGTGLKNDKKHHVYNKPIAPSGENDDELVLAGLEFSRLAQDFGADIIFVAAGADGHYTDRLSGLQYTEGGVFKMMGNLSHHFSTTPILIGGAGGYEPDNSTPAMWREAVHGVIESTVHEACDLRAPHGIPLGGNF